MRQDAPPLESSRRRVGVSPELIVNPVAEPSDRSIDLHGLLAPQKRRQLSGSSTCSPGSSQLTESSVLKVAHPGLDGPIRGTELLDGGHSGGLYHSDFLGRYCAGAPVSSPLVLSQDLICSYLMTGVQQKLNELYRDVHATFAARLVGLALSEPLFIAVPEAYERAGLRLVIVGQQTCSWYGGLGEHDVAGVLDCYRRFDLGGHGPHSPFWDHVHRLQRLLSPLVPEKGFVWANLVPCDQNRGRPVDCVLDALL